MTDDPLLRACIELIDTLRKQKLGRFRVTLNDGSIVDATIAENVPKRNGSKR